MKNLIAAFLICFSLIALLQAQSNFAPLGSYWNYNYSQHSGFYNATSTIKVTQDSVAGNARIKTLTLLEDRHFAMPPFQNGLFASHFGYLHHRNDSVFFQMHLQSPLQYIYSFDMSVGDSVHIDDFIGLYAVVAQHDSIQVSGQTKQRWTLTKYCDATFMDSVVVIEDIGPINDLLIWNSEGCLLGGGNWYFQCYSSDSLGYNQPCVPVVVGVETAVDLKPDWTLAPNPAQERFTASWSAVTGPVQLTVSDLHMRTLQTIALDGAKSVSVDVGSLPAGVYWVQLQVAGHTDVKRLAKLE